MGLLGLTLILLVVLAVVAIAAWLYTRDGFETLVFTGIAVVVLGCVWTYQYFQNYANDHVVACHVTGKDRGGDNGSYRVYTSDCGTLSNHDTWFRGKTNSGDVQGQIPDKGFITIHVAGSRFGLMSWMPNILEVVKSSK